MSSFFKNNFFSSISTLTIGSLIAQSVAVLCAPIITRLYTPDELGSFTYLFSFTAIFMGIINGKYDMAVVTETNEKKVFALIKLSLIVGIILTILGSIIYFTYNIFVLDSINLKDVIFVFFVLLSYAFITVLTSYNNRHKEYKVITSVNIIRSASQNIGSVILGFFGPGRIGLTLPYVVGQYLGIRRQGNTLLREQRWKRIKNTTRKELKEVMIDHKRQPLFSAPAALANSFSYSSITIFLNTLYGASIVGFYSISVRLLGLPLSLVSGNVSKVFFESATKEYNNTGRFYNSFKQVFLFQLALAIPMMIVMYFFAPDICEFVFGKEWRIAGDYIRILTPMFGIRFVVTTLTPAMIIVNKQNIEFFLQLGLVLSSLGCFMCSRFLNFSTESFLLIISLTFSIVYLIYLMIIFAYSKGKNKKFNRSIK